MAAAGSLERGARAARCTFGARLHAAIADRGPFCVGIDPHAALLHDWGLTDDVAGLETFALTVVEAVAPYVSVVKPQSAFFERFGSRGIAVLERVIAESPGGRRAGAARRQARRHRLDQSRRTPTPTSTRPRRSPSTRSRSARTSASARSTRSIDTARAPRRRRVRARADLQQGGPGGPARATADGRHRRRPDARPPAPAQRRRRAARLVRRGRRRDHRRDRTRTSPSTARSSRPGSAPRAAPSPTSPDLRRRPPRAAQLVARGAAARPGPRPRCATPCCAPTTSCAREASRLVLVALLLAAAGRLRRRTRTSYCDAVEEHQQELSEIVGSGEPDALIAGARRSSASCRPRRPTTSRDEWQQVVGRIDALEAALDDAGVDPATYDRDNPPAGLTDEQAAAIDAAATELGSGTTLRALQDLDQQARDVCKTPLTL